MRAEIATIRRQLTRHRLDAGPEIIAFHLERDGKRSLSISTIRRNLAKEGLSSSQPKKKPKSSFICFEAAMPNECWQADIIHIFLADVTRVVP